MGWPVWRAASAAAACCASGLIAPGLPGAIGAAIGLCGGAIGAAPCPIGGPIGRACPCPPRPCCNAFQFGPTICWPGCAHGGGPCTGPVRPLGGAPAATGVVAPGERAQGGTGAPASPGGPPWSAPTAAAEPWPFALARACWPAGERPQGAAEATEGVAALEPPSRPSFCGDGASSSSLSCPWYGTGYLARVRERKSNWGGPA